MRYAALLLMLAVSCDLHAQSSDGWITHATAGNRTPVVLHFRRTLELAQVPTSLPVTVTADNRFVLYVNGVRVASGPSTGTIAPLALLKASISPRICAAAAMSSPRWSGISVMPRRWRR